MNLESLHPNTEYNIMLLGETGTGKSTTINALANYLKCPTFEQAREGEFIQLVPSKFSLPDPTTGKPLVIKLGYDKNEQHSDGSSSTQSPMGYLFKFGDKTIRIIDTPGMGDTRGIEIDKENFDKILSFLRYHQNLHGICILVRAHESRKTTFFRYCINELLTHLHKSACQNMVFLFTHSRNTFYEPGDGFTTLRSFLQDDLKNMNIELRPGQNCYFIDNEAYRYLVAKKQNYSFQEDTELMYKESWEESSKQIEMMIKHITKLDPHILEKTALLNSVRKMLIKLAEPLVQLQANIQSNIDHIKIEEIRLRNASVAELTQFFENLTLDVYELVMRPLPYPTTVCTSDSCVEVLNTNGVHTINYKTRCHENCSLKRVEVNLIGDPILKGCEAMDCGKSSFCVKNCGCSWRKHMHITCVYEKVKRTIIRKSVNFTNSQEAAKCVNETLKEMQTLVKEYEDEYKLIQEVSSKFAFILSEHSNTPYNQYIEPYLDLLIKEEQKKITAVSDYSQARLESLEKMKKAHQENVQILANAISMKSQENVEIDNVTKYRNQLMALKHTGGQFRQMIEINDDPKMNKFKYLEKIGFNC